VVWMTLSVPRQIASVPLLRQLLDVVLRHRDVTARCRAGLAVLISEASANAVRHGHGDRPIEASIDVDDEQCVIEIGNCNGHLDQSRLLAGMPHDPHVLAVLRERLREGDVVLDVGANIGSVTLPAASLVGARGRVVAVEPIAANRVLLPRTGPNARAARGLPPCRRRRGGGG